MHRALRRARLRDAGLRITHNSREKEKGRTCGRCAASMKRRLCSACCCQLNSRDLAAEDPVNSTWSRRHPSTASSMRIRPFGNGSPFCRSRPEAVNATARRRSPRRTWRSASSAPGARRPSSGPRRDRRRDRRRPRRPLRSSGAEEGGGDRGRSPRSAGRSSSESVSPSASPASSASDRGRDRSRRVVLVVITCARDRGGAGGSGALAAAAAAARALVVRVDVAVGGRRGRVDRLCGPSPASHPAVRRRPPERAGKRNVTLLRFAARVRRPAPTAWRRRFGPTTARSAGAGPRTGSRSTCRPPRTRRRRR